MYKSYVNQAEENNVLGTLSENRDKIIHVLQSESASSGTPILMEILKSSFSVIKSRQVLSDEEKQLLHESCFELIKSEVERPFLAQNIFSQLIPDIHELSPEIRRGVMVEVTESLFRMQMPAVDLRIELAIEFILCDDYEIVIRLLNELIRDFEFALRDLKLCQTCILLAEAYLTQGDNQQAEQMLHRCANSVLGDIPHEWKLRYRVATSELCDRRRKFIDACRRFLSLSMENFFSEEKRLVFLTRSILMAILAPAGQLRFRLLASLFVDERSKSSELFGLLEKMYMGRLLKEEDMNILAPFIASHHKAGNVIAPTVDHELSLIDSIILEHNMFSANLLYNNISLNNLAKLLKVTPEIAESLASRMISEGRMAGNIDQIDGIVHFEKMNAMSRWDEHIYEMCQNVNRAYEKLLERYPDWVLRQQTNSSAIRNGDS